MADYKLYSYVKIGKNCTIEDNVVIGVPVGRSEELETIIGNNAHLRSGTIIYEGARVGDNFSSGNYAVVRERVVIGNNSVVGTHCLVLPDAEIGNGVTVHSLCEIAEYSRLQDNCWLGPGVILLNTKHPKAQRSSDKKRSDMEGAPIIGSYSRIGGNATILPFVEIGESAVVGAGAVVTKSVEPRIVVAGNPAKRIKTTDELMDVYDPNVKPYD